MFNKLNLKKEAINEKLQKKFTDKYINKWSVQLIFVSLCFLFSILNFHINKVPVNDALYHYLRWKDISLAIIHGQFPSFNIFTGSPFGIATNTFYPWIIYLPLIILTIFLPPSYVLCATFFFCLLIVIEIIYFSLKRILHQSLLYSFIVTMLCVFSSVFFDTNIDYGSEISLGFFMLSFSGWILWEKYSKWKVLCIGELLISLSNIPSLFISLLILITLTVLNLSQINIKRIKSLLKSIFLCISIGAIFYVPLIIVKLSNKIFTPNMLRLRSEEMIPVIFKETHSILAWIIPNGYTTWGAIDLIAIILCFHYFKSFTRLKKQLYIIGISIIIMNTVPVQSFILRYTFLRPIQYLSRLSPVGHLFLMLVLCDALFYIFNNHCQSLPFCYGTIDIIIILSILFLGYGSVLDNSERSERYFPSVSQSIYTRVRKSQYRTHSFLYNKSFENYQHLYHISLPPSYSDYAPLRVVRDFPRIHHINKDSYVAFIDYPKASLFIKTRDNHFKLYSKYKRNIKLPLLMYHQQKYEIYDNSKEIPIKYDNGYALIKAHKGENHIVIYTPMMWYRYISIIITVIGILIFIMISDERKNKK